MDIGDDRWIKIYGCHLILRPSHRSKLRFKVKEANDFILRSQALDDI